MGNVDLLLLAVFVSLTGALLWTERARRLQDASTASGAVMPPGRSRGYAWRLLRQAGISPEAGVPVLVATRALVAVAIPLLLAEAAEPSTWMLWTAPFWAVLPDGLLAFVRRQRRQAIRHSLSFFLDLLLSLLQAGLTLDEAFRQAAAQGLPARHPLAEEARRIVAELSIGRERSASFAALAERTGVEELAAIADAVSIGASRGVSLEHIIKAQADLARARRREQGLKRLDKASAEILLPLVLCSFPMFVAVVIVPLALQLMSSLEAIASALRP